MAPWHRSVATQAIRWRQWRDANRSSPNHSLPIDPIKTTVCVGGWGVGGAHDGSEDPEEWRRFPRRPDPLPGEVGVERKGASLRRSRLQCRIRSNALRNMEGRVYSAAAAETAPVGQALRHRALRAAGLRPGNGRCYRQAAVCGVRPGRREGRACSRSPL